MVLVAMIRRRLVVVLVVLSIGASGSGQSPETGILIMAHGGNAEWNRHVESLASQVSACAPAEVAFGMAARASLQAAAERLSAKGVREIVAVPLFVSSHSSVIEATRYLLGGRTDPPPQLELFARMGHDHGAARPPNAAAHPSNASGTAPIDVPARIRMTSALDASPQVAAILASRAREVSSNPPREVALIVAHGPEDEANNEKWLGSMKVIAAAVAAELPFARVEYLTVRDDASPKVREAATAELRTRVERAATQGYMPVVVPLLLSYGGIEAGIRKRLDGLSYVMTKGALLPDDRLTEWVLDTAGLSGCRQTIVDRRSRRSTIGRS